jgi:hypothetical protein
MTLRIVLRSNRTLGSQRKFFDGIDEYGITAPSPTTVHRCSFFAFAAARDHLKIRIITYVKTRQAIDFFAIDAAPILDLIRSVAGCASA